MTHKPRILLTGPVHSIERWADAAREAGWEPLVRPLVGTIQLQVDLAPLLDQPIEWLLITSSSSLESLARDPGVLERVRALRTAVVGTATAERARGLGLALAIDPAPDAAALARSLFEHAGPRALVLWPRGSLSGELARALRAGGLRVLDPIVYRTEPLPAVDPLPAAEAVLFASPSGVRAYVSSPRPAAAAPVAFVLGPSTSMALRDAELGFEAVHVLEQPDRIAFTRALLRLLPAAGGRAEE